ncbi:magnesium chelatase subunit D [Roseovarius sp. D22-M7]|uniref:magnesium chelatase subunit D n=1 Tax=Roseovarius sp. D22-M7 TaxID=3127116 RepID=UPI00300FE86B
MTPEVPDEMSGDAPPSAWQRGLRALTLLAVDPVGLTGLTLRARTGPVRQTFERALDRLPGPQRRIHPDLSDTQLFGGPDIAATLAEGRLVMDKGLAETPATLILPMAERCPPGLAARLGQLLDAGRGHSLILLDEGLDADEAAPAALTDRLAFHVDLDDTGYRSARIMLPAPGDLDAARAHLPRLRPSTDDITALVALALRFGIDSLRAPRLALRAAMAIAALDGRDTLSADDLREAAELVYPARATLVPQEAEPDAPEETPPDQDRDETTEEAPEDEAQDGDDDGGGIPDDMLVEAVRALLPPALLDGVTGRKPARQAASGTGAGRRRKGNRRGRPLPSRPGTPDGRSRIDVVATLRAAAPWQRLRAAQRDGHTSARRVIIHPRDIHLRRFEDRSDRLLIFTVDASGSAAMARLAEAKGAVELLLVQAYARRDQVAVIVFRGTGAELVLPPTRSLVQAKRRLAAMPGGGGTPLAAGLNAALALGHRALGQGLSPALALLTDGRANVALDGAGGRARAAEDVAQVAGQMRAQGLAGMVIDTANRPGDASAQLAAQLGAKYLALPRADADRISTAVAAALDG